MPFECLGVFLRLTGSTVSRGLVILKTDSFGKTSISTEQAEIVLASCPKCKGRVRVLPCDVLPRKTYSLPVIEKAVTGYANGDRSLREVAWAVLGDRTLSHATLHAWTEGLGSFALGRAGGALPGADPASRVLSETAARRPELDMMVDSRRFVDKRKFRSEDRQERLSGVVSILSIATSVAGVAPPDTLTEWRRLALSWSRLDTLHFATGILCTRTEQVGSREMTRSSPEVASRDEIPCRARSRSPPGGLK